MGGTFAALACPPGPSGVPHLDLLFVAAYPTSFFTSPTEFVPLPSCTEQDYSPRTASPATAQRGMATARPHSRIPLRPADLTAEHLWAHSDGELYWYISNGFEAPDGGVAMPGFDGVLSSEARWDLIDYLHAHNAGESMHRSGKWLHPLQVPQFDVEVQMGRPSISTTCTVARCASSPPAEEVPTELGSVSRCRCNNDHRDQGPWRQTERFGLRCERTRTWSALAILLGVSPGALAGSQVLVDQNTLLRAAWRQGDPG